MSQIGLSHNEQIANHCNSLGLDYQVLSSGSPSAQIAIIAEFPGEVEVQLKTPLVGGSGRYLWEQLGKIGVNRQQCYVTNVIKKKITEIEGNQNKKAVPKEEMNKWSAVLMEELSRLANVRYVLVLGNVALSVLTGHSGVKKWRGSVFNFTKEMGFKTNGQILISYNPAFVFRDPSVGFHFFIDIQRFKRLLNETYKPHHIRAIINPSARDALDYVRQLRSSRLPIAWDIETIGSETACIGFANSNHEGICLPFRRHDGPNYYSLDEEIALRLAMAELFSDPTLQFVTQNGHFDCYWMYYKDRILARNDFDTLLSHHTLSSSLPHSLGFLTTQYTEHPYYKDEKDTWKSVGDINQFWEYNVKDCCITRSCFIAMREELKREKLDQFFYNHVMKLNPHLTIMTVNGVLQDISMKEEVAKELTVVVDNLASEVIHKARVATGDPDLTLNPNSTPQLRDLFFNKLKLVGRGTSTDEANRTRIRSHPNTSDASKELLNSLDRYREKAKFLSTYIETSTDPDGRFRCQWKQQGVVSAPGRLSSDSVLWGTGGNLQNQPPEARKLFIAPEGYGFVYFDLSQAEARYVSEAWEVEGLKEAFRLAREHPDRYDVHRLNCARIFKIPYEETPIKDTDDDGKYTLRYKAKRCVHGLNYRMMPDKLAEVTGMTLFEATDAHRKYHTAYPEISRAWKDILSRVKADKALYNCFGRRWLLLGRLDDEETLKSIVAFEPQSSIGDKVCQVIYQSHEDKDWPRSSKGLEAAIAIDIHDALVALARFEDMYRVARILKRHAEQPLIVRGKELVIPAEIGLSRPDEFGVHRWSTITKCSKEELAQILGG